MNNKDLIILVSESKMAAHNAYPNLDIRFVSMNIPLNIKHNGKNYINGTQNLTSDDFKALMDIYNSGKDEYKQVYIWIGFDADEQGEYMAVTLKEILEKNGIKEEQMLRTPFCADNYVIVQSFNNMQNFLNFKGLERDFITYVRAYNKKHNKKLPTNISIRKLFSLRKLYINNNSNTKKNGVKKFKVSNNADTNTFTYITNYLKSRTTRKDGAHKWITSIR